MRLVLTTNHGRLPAFCLGLLVLPCLAAEAEVISVSVETPEAPGGVVSPSPIFVVAERVGHSDKVPAEVRAKMAVPGSTTLELAPAHGWQLRLEAEGWWAPPVRLDSVQVDRSVRFRAFEVGEIRGRVVGLETPTEATLTASFLRRPDQAARKAIAGVSECPVGEGGAFHCTVPAGLLDLRFESPGLAPDLVWNLEIDPGQVSRVETLHLSEPARLRGSVIDGSSGLPVDGAVVKVSPAALGELHLLEAERFDLAGSSVETVDGNFAFTALAPGFVDLEVSKAGYSPTVARGFRLVAGTAHDTPEALTLHRPATLEIFFRPTWAPDGSPWRVRLLRATEQDGVELLDLEIPEADPAGWWLANGLRPGGYRLQISTPSSRRWLDRHLALEPGLNTLQLELGGIAVEGTLVAGDEPVSGVVWFGGRTGETSICLEADEAGRFQGHLPSAGEWPIDVSQGSSGGIQRLPPVRVPEPAAGEPAVVEIEIPGTVLRGTVVDRSGEPVPDAVVKVMDPLARRLEAAGRSDGEGAFQIVGIGAGQFFVEAATGDAKSPAVWVDVPEDRVPPEVELVVAPEKTVRGVVVDGAGALPGASILAVPSTSVPEPVPVISTTTGADGRFAVSLGANVVGFTAFVQAPGHPLTVAAVPSIEGDVTLSVPEVGGSLRIQSDEPSALSTATLVYEGVAFPVSLYQRFAGSPRVRRTGGAELSLPAVAPGTYTLCPEGAGGSDRGREGDACHTAYLAPGGEVVLEGSRQHDE